MFEKGINIIAQSGDRYLDAATLSFFYRQTKHIPNKVFWIVVEKIADYKTLKGVAILSAILGESQDLIKRLEEKKKEQKLLAEPKIHIMDNPELINDIKRYNKLQESLCDKFSLSNKVRKWEKEKKNALNPELHKKTIKNRKEILREQLRLLRESRERV